MKAAPKIAKKLFEAGVGDRYIIGNSGNRYRIRVFQGHIKAIDLGGFRFVCQNPDTSSKWAKLAREGHEILWVIRLSDNSWVGRVVDGQARYLPLLA